MGKFAELCDLLPADVNWGDNITPDIVEQIILAEREATLNQVLRWLRSEDDTPQLRAIIASVEAMRSNAELTRHGCAKRSRDAQGVVLNDGLYI